MKKMSFDLEFRELSDDQNLYDDIDIFENSIVPAEYRRVAGYEDNPDVCAIPRCPTAQEIIDNCTVPLHGYDPAKSGTLKSYEKKEQIVDLQHVSCVLGVHAKTAAAINRVLLESYKGRKIGVALVDDNERNLGKNVHSEIISEKNELSGRTDGFLVTGVTGSGKSMAISLSCAMYPQVIRHSFDQCIYIQIPIIRVTSMVGNLSEIYRSIAAKIDKLLNCGNAHLSKIKTGNLGKAATYIKKWISLYHIGLLIIDEVQFFAFGRQKTSFENIIGITEDTGIAFGLIGNNETLDEIFAMPRIKSRVIKNCFSADITEARDRRLFEEAVKDLWKYQWGESPIPLTKEILSELIYQSVYNIALLKAIIVEVQHSLLQNKDAKVDRSFIQSVVSRNLLQLRGIVQLPSQKNDLEFREALNSLYGNIKAEGEKESRRWTEKNQKKETADKIKEACQILKNNFGYTISQAKRAINLALNENIHLEQCDTEMLVRDALGILCNMRMDVMGNSFSSQTGAAINAIIERNMKNYRLDE